MAGGMLSYLRRTGLEAAPGVAEDGHLTLGELRTGASASGSGGRSAGGGSVLRHDDDEEIVVRGMCMRMCDSEMLCEGVMEDGSWWCVVHEARRKMDCGGREMEVEWAKASLSSGWELR